MYIWFSQYMLIWYANIPEETVYFVRRQSGYWMPIFLMNLFLNWVVPFVVLLPKWTKRDPAILGKVAVVVLAGRLVDLYLMIFPRFAATRRRSACGRSVRWRRRAHCSFWPLPAPSAPGCRSR
jgi:hypothetical protein